MSAHAQMYDLLAYRQHIAVQVRKEEGTYVQSNKGQNWGQVNGTIQRRNDSSEQIQVWVTQCAADTAKFQHHE